MKKVLTILVISMLFLTGCTREANLKENIIGKWQVEQTTEAAKNKTEENNLEMLSYIILFSEGSSVEFVDESKMTVALGDTKYSINGNKLSIKVGEANLVLECKFDKEGNLLLEDKMTEVKLTRK